MKIHKIKIIKILKIAEDNKYKNLKTWISKN